MTQKPPVQGDLLLPVTVALTTIPEPTQEIVLKLIAQLLIDQLEATNEQIEQGEGAVDE